MRIASGSLGQGMSVALGTAAAKKLNQDNSLIYSLHGDGELQEGQNWEAIMYAGSKGVDNLIATIDVNGKQIDKGVVLDVKEEDAKKLVDSKKAIIDVQEIKKQDKTEEKA